MFNSKIVSMKTQYRDDSGQNSFMILKNQNGIKNFMVPSFNENAQMTFEDGDGKEYSASFALFSKLEQGESDCFTEEEREKLSCFFEGDELSMNYAFSYDSERRLAPSIHFTDHTEEYVLNAPEITQSILQGKDNGLWVYHGLRLLHFNISGFPNNVKNTTYRLEFVQMDLEKIEPVTMDGDSVWKTEENGEVRYEALLDTNLLGDALRKLHNQRKRVQCIGRFEITYHFDSVAMGFHDQETFVFPIQLTLVDTGNLDKDDKFSVIETRNEVSIDFGTSATCVAVDDGQPHLIRMTAHDEELSDQGERRNLFENPTNLMVSRWEKLYQQWQKENEDHPLVRKFRGGGENYLTDDAYEFDFGYSVKSGLAEADKRMLNSILTDLKLIPYYMSKGKEDIVNPYHIDRAPLVYLVSDCKSEDDQHFNPVSFYAYLLGRAINNPTNGKIYTRYKMTFPVKFNQEVRNQLLESFTYGLRRSLPRPVRDMTDKKGNPLLKVTMDFPEPVACAGAACGSSAMSLEDGKPKVFGIFDFGGGTLDFSYGMYRLGDFDNDDDEGWDEVMEIFGVDGDESIGGERLINLITYWIMTDESNRDAIIDNKISFLLPEGERILSGYDDNALPELRATPDARANTRLVNEAFSRRFFVGQEFELSGKIYDRESDDAELLTINLTDHRGESLEVGLNVNLGELKARLQERIRSAVKLFIDSMESLFVQPQVTEKLAEQKFDDFESARTTMRILLAGNSSRHPYVREAMEEYFAPEQIMLLGTADDDDDEYEYYRITPKTAVAIGQLKLGACKVNMPSGDEPPFGLYVARVKPNGFETIISKGTASAEWERLGVIRNGAVKVAYSTIIDDTQKSRWKVSILEFDEECDGNFCYIRPYRENSIEYVAVPRNQDPDTADAETMTTELEV